MNFSNVVYIYLWKYVLEILDREGERERYQIIIRCCINELILSCGINDSVESNIKPLTFVLGK